MRGSHSHGKAWGEILSWKICTTNFVIEIENILKKSWNFSTAYHESCTRSFDNSISIAIGLLQ